MSECLCCGRSEFDPLYAGIRDRLGHVPGERNFIRCRCCGSAQLDPIPMESELPGFYPPVYSFSSDLGGDRNMRRILLNLEQQLYFGPIYRAQVRRVLDVCSARPRGRSLLDLGCGRGGRLLEFRRRGFRVHGLDFQPQVVQELRDRWNIPAEVGDTSDLATRFASARFDLVTAFYLLEHVRDVRRVLADCIQILKPGGWMIAAVPLIDSLQAELFGRKWIHVTEAPRHIALPSRAGLSRAAYGVGFTEIQYRPDVLLHSAGPLASSIVSGATLTHVYGGGRTSAIVKRILGGLMTMAAVPFCYFEHTACDRMSHGILFARKPGG